MIIRFLRNSITQLTVILISLSCIVYGVTSSNNLFISELPSDNFVNLRLSIDRNNGENFVATASGFAYRTIDDFTYILSAQHFCLPYEEASNIEEIESAHISVTNLGNIQAFPVFIDFVKDLCLLKIDAIDIKNMNISSEMPVRGDKVRALSAPLGISEKGVILQFEGFYSGCNVHDTCFFTIPSASGSSGSIILNQDGQIVSMIQMTTTNFKSVSLGVSNESIRLFLRNASTELGVDLLQ